MHYGNYLKVAYLKKKKLQVINYFIYYVVVNFFFYYYSLYFNIFLSFINCFYLLLLLLT